MYASAEGHLEVVRLLCEAGADKDKVVRGAREMLPMTVVYSWRAPRLTSMRQILPGIRESAAVIILWAPGARICSLTLPVGDRSVYPLRRTWMQGTPRKKSFAHAIE